MIKYYSESVNVAVLIGGVVSSSFVIQPWISFVGVFFPAMDNGAIGIQLSTDNANWYPLLDPADGEALVVCAAASDPGFMDISDFVRFVAPDMYVRFTCAAQASGAVTITVFKRG